MLDFFANQFPFGIAIIALKNIDKLKHLGLSQNVNTVRQVVNSNRRVINKLKYLVLLANKLTFRNV